MSLLTYQETRPWAKGIREAVAERTMPPFHADAPLGHFRNDPRLSDAEIATVLRWVDAGAPRGNPEHAPPPKEWPTGDWTRGEPDLVIEFPEYTSVPDQVDRRVLLYSDELFDDQMWADAFELRASDYRLVHHVGVFNIDKKDSVPERGIEELREEDTDEFVFGKRNVFTWLPGQLTETRPPGSAFLIRKRTRFVLQVHIPPTDQASPIKVSLGVWRYNGAITRTNETAGSFMFDLVVPAGNPNYVSSETLTIHRDVTVTGFNVHMHLRGKSSEIRFHYPDGHTETVFRLPRFDFDWQRRYWLSKPLSVPAGTQFEFIGVWDNSADNPFNPDPTADVTWGRRTVDEMYTGLVYFSVERNKVAKVVDGRVVDLAERK
jgi:hypothetical protein